MDKTQRSLWLALTEEVDTALCTFCRFGEGYDCCDFGCSHTLAHRFDHHDCDEWGLEPGMDCWGFRPRMDISFAADIVGILLARGWDEWSYQADPPTIHGHNSRERR